MKRIFIELSKVFEIYKQIILKFNILLKFLSFYIKIITSNFIKIIL